MSASENPRPQEPNELLKYLEDTPEMALRKFLQSVEWEIAYVRRYVNAVASGFDREFTALDSGVSEAIASEGEDKSDAIIDDASLEAFELTEHFPTFAWQMTFVAIYSLLEYKMFVLCRCMQYLLKIDLDVRDMKGKGKGIFKAQRYLKKHCGIIIPPEDQEWREIESYNMMRNAIVHTRGDMTRVDDATHIREYVKGKKGIELDGITLKLSKVFCLESLNKVQAFFKFLHAVALKRFEKPT